MLQPVVTSDVPRLVVWWLLRMLLRVWRSYCLMFGGVCVAGCARWLLLLLLLVVVCVIVGGVDVGGCGV